MNTVLEKSILKFPAQLAVTTIPVKYILAGPDYHLHSGCILQFPIGAVPAGFLHTISLYTVPSFSIKLVLTSSSMKQNR